MQSQKELLKKIKWETAGIETRKAVCEILGWKTHEGITSRTGQRIARTEWQDLSNTVRAIFLRHGIVE